MINRLTITAYSTARFSTWIFVEELRLLLDAGDGVSAGLLQKSRKIDWVAITHPDRDHIHGLFQLLQLNARDGKPQITYPKDSGSFPAMENFCRDFDPHSGSPAWTPVAPGDEIGIGRRLKLRVIENSHIDRPGFVKSVGYLVVQETEKLKARYAALSSKNLVEIKRTQGADSLTELQEDILLGYSGDTGVGDPRRWSGCQLLIHESTFLEHAHAGDRSDRNQHSVLGDVLEMARDSGPGTLILNHFSSRYKPAEVIRTVRENAKLLSLEFPVYVIPPGEIIRDILSREPVWIPEIPA